MDMVRHRPNNIRDFSDQLARLFDVPALGRGSDFSTVETSQWVPAVDIREDSERFIVQADVPGVRPEDIEVTMENGTLAIRGERSHHSSDEQGGIKRVERAYGVFYRRFALPDTADPEAIKAHGNQGVLTIEIGKRETARSRRIPVEQQ